MHTTLGRSPFAGMKDSVMGEFMHYVGNNFGKERLNKIVKSFSAAGDSGSLQQFIGKKLKGFYAIKGKEAFHIPSFDNLVGNDFNGARYSVIRDNATAAPSPWIHQWQVADDLRIMDIPFHIEFSNLSDGALPLRYNNLLKLSFDKDAFRQGVKKKLDKYYDLEKYLLNDIDMLSYVKKHFEQELSTQVVGLKSSLLADPKAMLLSKISYDELLKLDMDQVKEKIMPAAQIQPLRDQLAAYEEVITKQGKAMLPAQKDSLQQLINNRAGHLASLEQMVAKVGEAKSKLSASGLNANDITRLQQSANAQTLKKWQQPATIKEAAENLLPQNGFQRFFKDITALNAGTFGANMSERTVTALLSGGLQMEALKKNNLLSGGFGKIKDAGFLKDAGLQNSLFSPAVSMQYAQFGKGVTGNNSTRITVMNGNTFSPNTLHYQAQAMARNMFVGTISKTIKVRKSGTVEAELSKSATQFRNTGSISPDQAMEHKSALYSYADDLLQTLSVGVRYQDDWDKINLSHNAHIAYAGFGYNNPGNPSASRGSLQYDLQLRKYVEKRKGFVQVQMANRNYNYSADGEQRWKNLQLNLQARYRFTRNITLGARLNQYQLVRKTPAGKQKMYVSRKIAADGQLSGDIAGISQRSIVSLGFQQFDNILMQHSGNSNLLLLQWVTTVPLQKLQATASIFYNKELTENKLIGDQLNGELGIGYNLLKTVMVNSSLTWLDNKMAARQIGTRQSINTIFFKNCIVGLYIDWRKDLVTPVNPYLYGNFRGELSVHYLIK
ncbi:hypothetical protein HB364_09625 [Pseudoflavitalea sp. X16]|uniref:hypothetical protein n=1 Tax=Paraflavitalea devenefica TaxID=2716334 RepID=UPI0014215FB0|nr:hypothetical protein [Paraflavitalea devenefica]NII25340.1 hypothetical protein [Paraflavitalea devenefica]